LGEEPFPYEFSEQDLFENIRPVVRAYNSGQFRIPILRDRYRRLSGLYDALQGQYIELAGLLIEAGGALPGHLDFRGINAAVREDCDGEEVCGHAQF
jgi:hypothetical protein